MTAYRKFKLVEATPPPAKMANLAKVHTSEPETLATLATLAVGYAQTANPGVEPTAPGAEALSSVAPFPVGMPEEVADRKATALKLKADGLSVRQIAASLGAPKSTIARDLVTSPAYVPHVGNEVSHVQNEVSYSVPSGTVAEQEWDTSGTASGTVAEQENEAPLPVPSHEIIQGKPLPKKPSKPSKPPAPDEMPEAARPSAPKPAQKRKTEILTPAAREMERETYRLPEQVAARGDPLAQSSVPPLKEQGDYCATRGMGYLAAFWEELTPTERRRVGGKPSLDAWKAIAAGADAGTVGRETKAEWIASHRSGKGAKPCPPANVANPAKVRPHEVEIEERAGMAAAGVPEPYLDAWARLQARKPGEVSEAQWRQAIDDAGLFLDKLAKRAADYGWTDRDVFDPPCRGVPGGLLWFTRGRPVASIGPGFASVGTGHVVFNRTTRQSWQNPYVLPCETLQ